MNLFAELKRRHIYRVAAAYAVVAWVLLQLFNNLEPILKLPEWAGTLVLVFLVGGFPITLLIAWGRELAPADGAPAGAATTKLDYALIGALVVVIALVSYEQLTPTRASKASPQVQASASAVRTTANSLATAISVAVLPFTNLSSDKEQEFFSDGMTDEISGALAKIPDLRVVARTSAFQFKGQNRDIQAIGQQLHTTHLIEGSVRKAGNRVRISAELVQADNGLQIWSNSYDRELTDVFAIQEDIATAIAGAFHMSLGLKSGENLVNSRTKNEVTYEDYLRAKALVRARGAGPAEAVKLLEQAIARDPDYAPAWGLLGTAYYYTLLNNTVILSGAVEPARLIVELSLSKAEAAAQRAIQLDPKATDGYLGLGHVQHARGKQLVATDLYLQPLVLDPGNPDALQS
jgi:TolB-like protein